MSFRNVSIRLKIAVAFGVVLLLQAAMGCIAVNSLSRVNATTTEFHDDWMPSIRFVDEIRYNVARHRAILSRHVMSSDAAQKTQVENRLTNAIAALTGSREKFEALPHAQNERDAYAGFVSALTGYLKAAEEMMVVSRRNDYAEAGRLYITTVSKIGLDAETVLDQLTGLIREAADKARNSGQDRYDYSRMLMIGSIILGVIVASLSGYLLNNAVSRPVLGMTHAMVRLSRQDMDVAIPALGQSDEIGQMAKAMAVFKDSMIESARLRAEQADSETNNRMRQKETMQKLANDFEAAVGVVVGAVSSASGELETAALTLTKTADITRDQVQDVVSSSDDASKNVQAVASATEEMASSVSEIGRQVEASAKMANDAVMQAQRTDEQISRLTKAAEQIGGMVDLISTIAGQTNLLALNATIEAARAGEAGRGFAVVATEVKALAAQTAEATSVIGAQIAEIQLATRDSATAIRTIGSTIGDISGIASAIAAAVEEQGAATNEIARNIQHAAKCTVQVAGSMEQVNTGARETGTASSHVLTFAQSLSEESTSLKTEVAKFLASVRAA